MSQHLRLYATPVFLLPPYPWLSRSKKHAGEYDQQNSLERSLFPATSGVALSSNPCLQLVTFSHDVIFGGRVRRFGPVPAVMKTRSSVRPFGRRRCKRGTDRDESCGGTT